MWGGQLLSLRYFHACTLQVVVLKRKGKGEVNVHSFIHFFIFLFTDYLICLNILKHIHIRQMKLCIEIISESSQQHSVTEWV